MSISNNEIKKVKSLQQKKFRDETGLFIVEGEKMVREAIDSQFKVEKAYYRSEIGEEGMKRISALSNPSPALAVVHKPKDSSLDDASVLADVIREGGLFLALDTIRDPEPSPYWQQIPLPILSLITNFTQSPLLTVAFSVCNCVAVEPPTNIV